MKERPILFSGAMVRAILSGQKTQTRRVVNPYPPEERSIIPYLPSAIVPQQDGTFAAYTDGRKAKEFRCPYGQPGDRLWVRETFAAAIYSDGMRFVEYKADRSLSDFDGYDDPAGGRWRPSIHMPRWASRITLEITDVRVERLQDISEADAEAEGVDFLRHVHDGDEGLTARQLFDCLWSSINGDESWPSNPWVWVIEFKVVRP